MIEGPGAVLALPEVGVTLTLADVYAGLDFTDAELPFP